MEELHLDVKKVRTSNKAWKIFKQSFPLCSFCEIVAFYSMFYEIYPIFAIEVEVIFNLNFKQRDVYTLFLKQPYFCWIAFSIQGYYKAHLFLTNTLTNNWIICTLHFNA